jgi:hypothetical protein
MRAEATPSSRRQARTSRSGSTTRRPRPRTRPDTPPPGPAPASHSGCPPRARTSLAMAEPMPRDPARRSRPARTGQPAASNPGSRPAGAASPATPRRTRCGRRTGGRGVPARPARDLRSALHRQERHRGRRHHVRQRCRRFCCHALTRRVVSALTAHSGESHAQIRAHAGHRGTVLPTATAQLCLWSVTCNNAHGLDRWPLAPLRPAHIPQGEDRAQKLARQDDHQASTCDRCAK